MRYLLCIIMYSNVLVTFLFIVQLILIIYYFFIYNFDPKYIYSTYILICTYVCICINNTCISTISVTVSICIYIFCIYIYGSILVSVTVFASVSVCYWRNVLYNREALHYKEDDLKHSNIYMYIHKNTLYSNMMFVCLRAISSGTAWPILLNFFLLAPSRSGGGFWPKKILEPGSSFSRNPE